MRISDKKARTYYEELKNKVTRRGCRLYEDVKLEPGYYALYDPSDDSIRIRSSRSPFVRLIVLAHEFGHFLEHEEYYKSYGNRSYQKLIYKKKVADIDVVFSETSAWLYAERELNKIDVDICRDYRFNKYRRAFVGYAMRGNEK